MIHKWETIDDKITEDLRIFKTSWIKRRHPDNLKEGNFVVLKSPNWVNIIPITKEGDILLIEQYRHGIDEITLEVPGGLVDKGEDPRKAAERECLEETGYAGEGDAILIGENQPNPAFLNNVCNSFVWKNCKKVGEQNLDAHEEINVIPTPIKKIKEMIKNGKIKHSIVLTAFFFYFLRYSDL